jgi:hypothetical protein
MQVTINRVDGLVIIDGKPLTVDLSRMDKAIAVVQWDGVKARGWIEYVNDRFAAGDFRANTPIDTIADFSFAIDAYRAKAERLAQSPTLDQLKDVKRLQWERVRRAAILDGFQSSALGLPHFYSGAPLDQIAMISAIILQRDARIFCRDGTDRWAMRQHSVAQISEAFQDGRTAIDAVMDKYCLLLEQIEAATTPQALAAISL